MTATHVTADMARTINGPGPWWVAHEHPERPADGWVLWSWPCDACIMHLVAAANVVGDEYAESVTPSTILASSVAGTLSEARAWRAERGMRTI